MDEQQPAPAPDAPQPPAPAVQPPAPRPFVRMRVKLGGAGIVLAIGIVLLATCTRKDAEEAKHPSAPDGMQQVQPQIPLAAHPEQAPASADTTVSAGQTSVSATPPQTGPRAADPSAGIESQANTSAPISPPDAYTQGKASLTVRLAPGSPSGVTVPIAAWDVNMLPLELEASCEDQVVLRDIIVEPEMVNGETANIDRMTASVDGVPVSAAAMWNHTDKRYEYLLRYPHPAIPPCGKKTIGILVNFTTQARTGDVLRLRVKEILGTATSVTFADGQPLAGPTFTIGNGGVGDVQISYKDTETTEVQIGAREALLGRFMLKAHPFRDVMQQDASRSLTLESVTLLNAAGIMDSAGIALDGERVPLKGIETTPEGHLRLTFETAVTLPDKEERIFDVTGHVIGGEGTAVRLLVSPSAYDPQYGILDGARFTSRGISPFSDMRQGIMIKNDTTPARTPLATQ